MYDDLFLLLVTTKYQVYQNFSVHYFRFLLSAPTNETVCTIKSFTILKMANAYTCNLSYFISFISLAQRWSQHNHIYNDRFKNCVSDFEWYLKQYNIAEVLSISLRMLDLKSCGVRDELCSQESGGPGAMRFRIFWRRNHSLGD